VVKLGRNALQLSSCAPQNRHLAFLGPKFTIRSCRNLVFGCRYSVPRSWIPRQCWRPISLA